MAKKPKLTHRQKRQVSTNRSKRLAQAPIEHDHLGVAQPGLVVGRFGKHANVEDEQGVQHKCHIRRTINSVVCGDSVVFCPSISSEPRDLGVIEIVHDRKTVLTRPDFYDGVKPIAANIDQIIIVSSIVPTLSPHIIDRYLVACEDVQIQPVIVVNKMELLNEEDREMVIELLTIYHEIGYKVLLTSCVTGEGIDELAKLLTDNISVFVGQSGVGKSSLVNQLLPEADEVVGDISDNSGLGTHTTTTAKLLHFTQGGDVIDSPGVREFSLWHLPEEQITRGFIEFRDYLGGCKFRDCKHGDDPGCLIRAAVIDGDIDEARYESYHKIIDSMDDKRPTYSKS
ncbi:small ribosomal subunit biogenesis GTPase RsgA [Glaciecola sp. HTCC2999]|uniref:small ribosomal subunit biogenesis GTPase RsgA n=1 Tax=Glaciecola sp. HTCC2999 TaxID=455436 RepID=UPI0000E0EEB0|nr:small ribosomal subunit biogenesis GTPase RsgA [Glaciecola sp. HTCC2999]